jgi:hypothetical protein
MYSLHDMQKKKTHVWEIMSVCPLFQRENKWMNSDKILYKEYVNGGYPKLVHFNFLQLVIITRQMHKHKRCG